MSGYEEGNIPRNYKIPKRKFDDEMAGNPNTMRFNSYPNTENPVLGNSYYNNYYETPGLFGPWQQSGTYSQYPPANAVEPPNHITQNIYNTLSNIKEKPKTYRKNLFRETVPDVEDQSLPKELTAMFQPLYCKLCLAQLSSNVMAKMHYKSKNHEKKIKKYLIEYSEKTGEPLHKRAKVTGAPKTEDDTDPKWFHCDLCDLPLTGKLHAESHYMGKNHLKAMMGNKPPAGRGYYNDEGKWVRTVKKGPTLPPGEDGFGLDFRKNEPIPAPLPVATTSNGPPPKFHCDICSVGATCQEQLEMHYKGQKHQKKIRQLGLTGFNSRLNSVKKGNALDAKLAAKNVDVNLSVYRTPSGDLYCHTCNLTLNSEPQFKIHLKSKGHLKKSSQKS